jgi:hypothetical protein
MFDFLTDILDTFDSEETESSLSLSYVRTVKVEITSNPPHFLTDL